MVDAALAGEFPWLQHDPDAVLGDSRPRTVKELLGKDRLWADLYRDWLQRHKESDVVGLDFLVDAKPKVTEYTALLRDAYKRFYKDAGDMKDAVRRDAAAGRRKYPWAPADAGALLGNARPKDFGELVAAGQDSPWFTTYKSWLASTQPFAEADSWLDWLIVQGEYTTGWERSLDASLTAFAGEIGRVKERLRDKHGNKAQRIIRQVGDKIDDAGEEAARRGIIGPREQRGPGAKQAQQGGQAQQGPGKGAPGGTAARSQVPQHVRAQLVLAMPLLTSAPQLSDWVKWLSGRFSGLGGTLAAEAANLDGYKALIDQDATYLSQQMTALSGRLTSSGDDALFTMLATVRAAVFRLAWDIDLGYTSYYGGWPHQRITTVVHALAAVESPQLRYEGGMALTRLITDLDGVYDTACGVLDTTLDVIAADVPGYDIEDGAVAWGAHEMLGAKAELSGLAQLATEWAGQEPAEQEDQAELDQASQATFGLPYQNLLQAVR